MSEGEERGGSLGKLTDGTVVEHFHISIELVGGVCDGRRWYLEKIGFICLEILFIQILSSSYFTKGGRFYGNQ